jgi:hypothetical protein
MFFCKVNKKLGESTVGINTNILKMYCTIYFNISLGLTDNPNIFINFSV